MKDAYPMPIWLVDQPEYDTEASPDWYASGI